MMHKWNGKIKWNKRKIVKVVIGGIVLLIIGKYVFTTMNKGNKKEDAVITTQNCVKGDIQAYITGNGTLTPIAQYEVKSLVKGEVVKAPFEEGDKVKKGDLLYKISTKAVDNSVKTAMLALEKAQSTYEESVAEKDKLIIYADNSGYVRELSVKEGDSIQEGSTLAQVYDDSSLDLAVLFPKQEAKESLIGKKAVISMDETSEQITGTVKKILDKTETLGGGIVCKKVIIRVKNTGGIQEGDKASASVGDIYSNNVGTFSPVTKADIKATASGKIEKLNIQEGQRIEKGEQIVTLQSKELNKQIEDNKESIKEAELNLQVQKDQLADYSIESPIAGSVITKNKKKGDTIDPTTDSSVGPMAIIYDMSALTFEMGVDELDINKVSVGQKVTITAAAVPGKDFEGVVDRISLKGKTSNGATTYPVTVKLTDYDSLLPGMNVTGKIITQEASSVLTIPSAALQRGNIVYVKKAKNDDAVVSESNEVGSVVADDTVTLPKGFVAVTVEVGINDGVNVEIISGLSEGDVVYIPYTAPDVSMDMYSDYGDSGSTDAEASDSDSDYDDSSSGSDDEYQDSGEE